MHDYDIARKLEIDFILIANGHKNKKILKSSTANVVESIKALDL